MPERRVYPSFRNLGNLDLKRPTGHVELSLSAGNLLNRKAPVAVVTSHLQRRSLSLTMPPTKKDLPRMTEPPSLDRRRAMYLLTVTAAGGALLNQKAFAAEAGATAADATSLITGADVCVITPEVTEGPY